MTQHQNKGRLASLGKAFSIDVPLYKKFANAVIAARWIKITRKYVSSVGLAPNYIDPTSYTEKMQCRKLFDRNPIFPIFCDKLSTREYIAEKGFKNLLPQLLWSGPDPKMIPFDALIAPYIIKPSHRSGAVYVVRGKDDVDESKIHKTCKKWISRSYGRGLGEWGYQCATRMILIEELLPSEDNEPYPKDYKLFVFGGHVVFIHVRSVQDTPDEEPLDAFFDRTWKRMPYCRWRQNIETKKYPDNIPKPTCLTQMIDVAEKLAESLDYLRVDFYVARNSLFVGELTVYDESGFKYWFPENSDYINFPPRTLNDYYGSIWHQAKVPMVKKFQRIFWSKSATL